MVLEKHLVVLFPHTANRKNQWNCRSPCYPALQSLRVVSSKGSPIRDLTVLLNCGDPTGSGVTEQFIIWLVFKGLGHQPVSDNWVKLEIYF